MKPRSCHSLALIPSLFLFLAGSACGENLPQVNSGSEASPDGPTSTDVGGEDIEVLVGESREGVKFKVVRRDSMKGGGQCYRAEFSPGPFDSGTSEQDGLVDRDNWSCSPPSEDDSSLAIELSLEASEARYSYVMGSVRANVTSAVLQFADGTEDVVTPHRGVFIYFYGAGNKLVAITSRDGEGREITSCRTVSQDETVVTQTCSHRL